MIPLNFRRKVNFLPLFSLSRAQQRIDLPLLWKLLESGLTDTPTSRLGAKNGRRIGGKEERERGRERERKHVIMIRLVVNTVVAVAGRSLGLLNGTRKEQLDWAALSKTPEGGFESRMLS